eukprot:GCRY01001326.1.p2 GENE.GCRY01001326.1~~GCRY01001326.1.p2  ORF type:complete len:109 (+),score=11.84 GCRY01001326.1:242-568(+)
MQEGQMEAAARHTHFDWGMHKLRIEVAADMRQNKAAAEGHLCKDQSHKVAGPGKVAESFAVVADQDTQLEVVAPLELRVGYHCLGYTQWLFCAQIHSNNADISSLYLI